MAELSSEVWEGKPYEISQPFGYYNPELAGWYEYAKYYGYPAGTHIGLDVAVPKGTAIHAAQSGTVVESGFNDSFRPYPVIVEEEDGDIAIYGHLWSNVVSPGQKVRAGQFLGRSGEQTVKGTMTPDGSGPHIHFELRRPDPVTGGYKAVDPAAELTGAPDGGAATGGDLWGVGSGDAEKQASSGLKRALFFAVGLVVAAVGLWAAAGAPLPPQAAILRKVAT